MPQQKRIPYLRRLLFTVSMVVALFAAAPALSETINIGSRLELFVDFHLIDVMREAELRLHHPVKMARPKSPLPAMHYSTIIKDSDEAGVLYRAYGRGEDPSYTGRRYSGHPGETVQYAESRDGHEWTFPNLGMHEVGGTYENNVILAKQPMFLHNFVPFLDTRPGVDTSERYKALAGYPGPGDKRGLDEEGRGLFAFVSADGIHWTKKDEVIRYRPQWRHAFDSSNVAFWSAAEQLYVCYFRTWTDPERLRSVSRTTSLDFDTWSEPVELNPNLAGEHLYVTNTQPYFRAPHIYIATPTRFVPHRGDAPSYDKKDVNATDILFMSTRAGSTQYDRAFTEAFIRPGLDPQRWHNRSNYVANNVIPTGPAEMSIYHRSGDRYTLRTDGFISVHAGSEEGEFLTKPLVFSGSALVLNFSTSAAGSVRVEIQQSDGAPITGFTLADFVPLYGDAIERPVSWNGDDGLGSLAGKAVRLRFLIVEADLYSIQFR